MSLTLYSVSDGPPSLAVRQCLKALNLDYKLINVDFGLGEHMTEEYAKVK
jgi:glutathione S-transferase